MHTKHKELSRFSVNGKTFFFNQAAARNGSPYLAVNALYGRGNQERMVLFEPHLMQFKRHLDDAVATLTGMQVVQPEALQVEVASPEPLPTNCPECGFFPQHWQFEATAQAAWCITCGNCASIVLEAPRD